MKDISSWRKRSKKILDEKCVEWKGGKTIIGNHGFHFLQRLSFLLMLIGIRNISFNLLIVLLQVCTQALNPSDSKIFVNKWLIELFPSYVLELELGRSRDIEDWVQVIILYFICTVVGLYINIIKTTLDSNFDF